MSAFWSDAKRQLAGSGSQPLWSMGLLSGGVSGGVGGVLLMWALGGEAIGGWLAGVLLGFTLYISCVSRLPPRPLPARRWLCGVKDCTASKDMPSGDTRLPYGWWCVNRTAPEYSKRVHLLDGTILDAGLVATICPLHAMPEPDPLRPPYVELVVGKEPMRRTAQEIERQEASREAKEKTP